MSYLRLYAPAIVWVAGAIVLSVEVSQGLIAIGLALTAWSIYLHLRESHRIHFNRKGLDREDHA